MLKDQRQVTVFKDMEVMEVLEEKIVGKVITIQKVILKVVSQKFKTLQ